MSEQTEVIKARFRLEDYVQENGIVLRKVGSLFEGLCPFHNDHRPSFQVDPQRQTWECRGACAAHGDIIDFVRKQKGIDFKEALHLLATEAGVTLNGNGPKADGRRRIAAIYPYTDENGKLLFQALRYHPKDFNQRQPDGDKWVYNIKGVRTVLYRLPEMLKSDTSQTVFIAEGEKDVDVLRSLGLVATCNPMGAGKWQSEYSDCLSCREVVILPDNDSAGQKHAQQVAQSLYGKASTTKVIDLPGLPEHGDVSDWLGQGHIREELLSLVDTAPTVINPETNSGAQEQAQQPEQGAGRPSSATRLIRLAEEAKLFHTPNGEGYASVKLGSHEEVYPVKSHSFRQWLARRFYMDESAAAPSQAMQDALSVLEARASFDGKKVEVFTRLALHNGNIYLDLANDNWEAVEITPNGWTVLSQAPIMFRRPRGMMALPYPANGRPLHAELGAFLNTGNEDRKLLEAWLIQAAYPSGPYPILVFHGDHGTAKSTSSRVLRAIIDPATTPLRATPKEPRDLMIAAENTHIVTFDNLSNLSDWLSDALCRLSTGGGFSTRALYSDKEEALFEVQRPAIINGIEELATRSDLLDRAIITYLPYIPQEKRIPERQFWSSFEEAHPRILGALLTAVSGALREIPNTRLTHLPRMADFALWATAAEKGAGDTTGAFMKAYTENRNAANALTLEAAPIAQYVQDLAGNGEWTGTATELLAEINKRAGDEVTRQKSWPKRGKALSDALRRITSNLRATGIDIAFDRQGKDRTRIITISQREGHSSSASSASSAQTCFGEDTGNSASASASANGHPASAKQGVRPPNQTCADAEDEADAKVPIPATATRTPFDEGPGGDWQEAV